MAKHAQHLSLHSGVGGRDDATNRLGPTLLGLPQWPTSDVEREFVPLTKERLRERFLARFYDPAFDAVKDELEKVFERAWDGYREGRKIPRTTPAGAGFADPAQELAIARAS